MVILMTNHHLYPLPLKLPVSQSNSASQVHNSRPHLCYHHHHHFSGIVIIIASITIAIVMILIIITCLPITRAPPVASIPIRVFISVSFPISVPVATKDCIKYQNLKIPFPFLFFTCLPSIDRRDSDHLCSTGHCL